VQGGGTVTQRGDVLSFGVLGVKRQVVAAAAESLGRGGTGARSRAENIYLGASGCATMPCLALSRDLAWFSEFE
jgi:hypothetical protein